MKRALAPLLLCGSAGLLAGQQTPAFNDAREAMWWAPTAEDWAKPCLVEWQRTWDDAVELSRRTGDPILVCVNMDGEIASEHYAGVRYRQPEIAQIYEPYVCVIASVYRHTPRDYDEDGNRVLCPRFGSVTCGEHIAIEPLLYESYMEGQRVAPRHIMVELDGAETYDVYYANDTESVFRTVRKGIEERPPTPPIEDRGDETLAERVANPANSVRVAVEREYRRGDRDTKRALVRASIEAGEDAPVDLLRLAVFDLDAELNRMARLALAQAETENAIGLINEALRAPMSAEERDALIAALVRLGETYPRAKTLAAVHQGLAASSDSVDLAQWTQAFGGTYPAPGEVAEVGPGRSALEYQLESVAHRARNKPDSADTHLEFAEASLALVVDPEAGSSLAGTKPSATDYTQLVLEDAYSSAQRAAALGARGWRTEAVLAVSSYYLGRKDEAYERAASSVELLPTGDESWNAMAVLGIFAEGRQREIRRAVREEREWPKEWLTDVNAAYAVLARHPLGTDEQAAAHIDFLRWLGAFAQAERALEAGLGRFPDSVALHTRLRNRLLWEKGAAGLEEVYDRMLQEEEPSANLEWFAGYASMVAGEYHRRGAELDNALASYDRAVRHFDAAALTNPNNRDSADHYIAMAHAARARVALVRGDLERAADEVLRSFEVRPEAASSLDGLGFSAVTTATTLRVRLSEAGLEARAAELQAALDALPPEQLLPPEFDRVGPRWQGYRQGR